MDVLRGESATEKGIRSAGYAFLASTVSLLTGIYALPGAPELVQGYLADNFLILASLIGLSTGVIGLLYNILFRKEVPNRPQG